MFAKLVRETRKERGWSQHELADRTGVERRTVGRWEKGDNIPDPEQANAVASALGISTEEVFRALGWLPADERSPREELWQLVHGLTEDELETFLTEYLEYLASRRRNPV